MSDIAVIGAGAWGTALAIQAARSGDRVALWARDPAKIDAMRRTRSNPRLPNIDLPDNIDIVGDFPVGGTVLLVVPAQHLRAIARAMPIPTGPVVVCAKGVEVGTLRLPLEILAEVWPNATTAVLTGPNFAHEVAAGLPAAAVVASRDSQLREAVADRLASATFRLYGNDDPIGAQVGGAAKNVVAIAAGAVVGAGLGENARAALLTRGLAELARLIAALGGRPETAMGLSGLGDLLLTCTGAASRNFSLGLALGQGQRLSDILANRQSVTEGVATAPALIARAQGIEMPICSAVARLLDGSITLRQAIDGLLSRPLRDE